MIRLPDSDLWYYTRRLPSDTRTTYQLSPSSSLDPSQSAPYQLDPLNQEIYTVYPSEEGNDIRFSLLELPNAPELPWRQRHAVEPGGTVQLHKPFADQRRLWTYLPPIRTEATLPLLVVFDGRLYKELLHLPEMLDYLINQGQIPPVAALLVDNMDRSELLCQPEFSRYMTGQVLPWLRASYPVTNDPRLNLVIGSSYGGLAAAFLGFQYPEVWGTVLSQTGWFRWHPEEDPEHHWLTGHFSRAPRLPLRFWLQVGKLEVAQMLDGGPSQQAANQYFRDALLGKDYPVSYYEYSGGHDMSSLEYPLAKALREIFQ
jgi:enterochelin esterase family protein